MDQGTYFSQYLFVFLNGFWNSLRKTDRQDKQNLNEKTHNNFAKRGDFSFSFLTAFPILITFCDQILKQVNSAPPMNSSSMPLEKERKKKYSSLENENSFSAKQKIETSNNGKQKSLDEKSTNIRYEKQGFFERKGQQLKQKLHVKSDSCDSGTKKTTSRKIGIFKEKCLEMPDDGSDPPSTISTPERSDFLGGRRGMTKQKNVELPEFLGPPEKTGKVDVLTDFLGPPEKFDSAPRSRSQSIEVAFFNYFFATNPMLNSGGRRGRQLVGGDAP